ncbi:hypothetical protein AB1M95_17460 [Sulfitobacter sp. LCG007]
MRGLRKLSTAISALTLTGAACAAAEDHSVDFAICTGRLSALLEHQWLMADAGAQRTEALRAVMIDLLDVSTPSEKASRNLGIRIEAKMAHAQLLTLATFNDDPAEAAWARRRADTAIAACAGLLLG